MNEQPVMAVRPTDIKVLVVRDSSTSAAREREMSQHFPSLSAMIGDALGKLESSGYALLDIRYSAIPVGGEGYEHFAMVIGRRLSGEGSTDSDVAPPVTGESLDIG
ncbi:hypothetical protein BH24CHL4_BH24CHL4_13540 [soil metagenome]